MNVCINNFEFMSVEFGREWVVGREKLNTPTSYSTFGGGMFGSLGHNWAMG